MTHVRLVKKPLAVDFPIGPGITAIYGPREAGKSLLLDCIGGFATPDSGRILLDDVILFDAEARVNVPPGRRNCGYAPQRDGLFPHMNLRQNLRFAAQRFPRLERHRRVSEMLERFRLKDNASTPAERVYGSIARALIGEPRLLLVDDCGADEFAIRTARAACTCPILLATRDLDLSCAAAGDMILLDRGHIVQRGAPRDVIDRPESLEAARLVGMRNLFEGTIVALDPGRDSSRLEFERFALSAPYIPGHFKGDRVWAGIHATSVRVHAGEIAVPINSFRAELAGISEYRHSVRLEFEGGIFAEISHAAYAARKDNKTWQVEFPPEALRIL